MRAYAVDFLESMQELLGAAGQLDLCVSPETLPGSGCCSIWTTCFIECWVVRRCASSVVGGAVEVGEGLKSITGCGVGVCGCKDFVKAQRNRISCARLSTFALAQGGFQGC